jgi:hypothetical protein
MLNGGVHTIRVSYNQGPRFQVALVLRCRELLDRHPPQIIRLRLPAVTKNTWLTSFQFREFMPVAVCSGAALARLG